MTRTGMALVLLLAVVALAVARPPAAAIRIAAHDPADLAPHRLEAAIDIGLIALSLIVTWSGRPAIR